MNLQCMRVAHVQWPQHGPSSHPCNLKVVCLETLLPSLASHARINLSGLRVLVHTCLDSQTLPLITFSQLLLQRGSEGHALVEVNVG